MSLERQEMGPSYFVVSEDLCQFMEKQAYHILAFEPQRFIYSL